MKDATGAPILIHKGDAPMLNQLVAAAASFGLSAENSPAPDKNIDAAILYHSGILSLKLFTLLATARAELPFTRMGL